MLLEQSFQPRIFLDKFDGARGSSFSNDTGLSNNKKNLLARISRANLKADPDIDLSLEKLPPHPKEEYTTSSSKVNSTKGIITTAALSPTLSGTIGHVVYQMAMAPWMVAVQIVFGTLSLANEIREKHFGIKKIDDTKHVSDGSWKSFSLDLAKSPALQRIFEGTFYGVSSLILALYNPYLACIFATGAIASLASAHYMNSDVNYWHDKTLPKTIQSILAVSNKLPAFISRLATNPGFWACIADGMIAMQRIIDLNQLAIIKSNPLTSTFATIGIVCFATGIAQALKLAATGRELHKYAIEDKGIATCVAGFGNLGFGICNLLLQNYVIGSALILWSLQSFLMTARINKVELASLTDRVKH